MLDYVSADAASKPCQVNVVANKLGGQATQNWCLIRLLPVTISDIIMTEGDPI